MIDIWLNKKKKLLKVKTRMSMLGVTTMYIDIQK